MIQQVKKNNNLNALLYSESQQNTTVTKNLIGSWSMYPFPHFYKNLYRENFHLTCIILDLPEELKEILKIREQMQSEHLWHNRKQYPTANHITTLTNKKMKWMGRERTQKSIQAELKLLS